MFGGVRDVGSARERGRLEMGKRPPGESEAQETQIRWVMSVQGYLFDRERKEITVAMGARCKSNIFQLCRR